MSPTEVLTDNQVKINKTEIDFHQVYQCLYERFKVTQSGEHVGTILLIDHVGQSGNVHYSNAGVKMRVKGEDEVDKCLLIIKGILKKAEFSTIKKGKDDLNGTGIKEKNFIISGSVEFPDVEVGKTLYYDKDKLVKEHYGLRNKPNYIKLFQK